MQRTSTILFIRFLCIIFVLFMAFIIDAGIVYFSQHMAMPIIFGIFLRSALLTAWLAIIFAIVELINNISGSISNYTIFRSLMISDMIFVNSIIAFVFYIYYFGSGSPAVSITDSDGILVDNGQFTMLGLHKTVSNIATSTFSALFLHFMFLLHALAITRRTD